MVKIALIGAGNMATEHLRVLAEQPNVIIAGIHSRTRENAEKLAAEFKIQTVASSVKELYSKTSAHAVIIAVSETSAEEILTEALSYPWKILAEKPVGLTLKSTKRILDLARANKRKLYVAMNRRKFSSILHASAKLQNVPHSRIVNIIDQEDPLSALKSGREKEVCDQWHFANSIHLVDLFFVFCRGNILSVNNVVPWKSGYNPKCTHSIIRFDSGDIGVYHSLWNSPGPWAVSIETAKQRFEMRPIENLYIQTYPNRFSEEVEIKTADLDFKPGFLKQIQHFISVVEEKSGVLVDIEQYWTGAKLTHKLYSEC